MTAVFGYAITITGPLNVAVGIVLLVVPPFVDAYLRLTADRHYETPPAPAQNPPPQPSPASAPAAITDPVPPPLFHGAAWDNYTLSGGGT